MELYLILVRERETGRAFVSIVLGATPDHALKNWLEDDEHHGQGDHAPVGYVPLIDDTFFDHALRHREFEPEDALVATSFAFRRINSKNEITYDIASEGKPGEYQRVITDTHEF